MEHNSNKYVEQKKNDAVIAALENKLTDNINVKMDETLFVSKI